MIFFFLPVLNIYVVLSHYKEYHLVDKAVVAFGEGQYDHEFPPPTDNITANLKKDASLYQKIEN